MEQKQPDPSMTVPASVLQNILNYLAARPFQEVAGLIESLRNNAKLAEEAPSDDSSN